MLSKAKYLFKTPSGNFQIIMRIPSDLQPILNTKLLKQSLKTSNTQQAELILNSKIGKIQSSFTLLRAGILNEDQIEAVKASLTPSKHIKKANKTLSQLIESYIAEKTPNWSKASRVSYTPMLKAMVDLLGDKDLIKYTRDHVSFPVK